MNKPVKIWYGEHLYKSVTYNMMQVISEELMH